MPDGWESRTIAVSHEVGTRGNTGHCVEVHDLAVSKLVAFREKDRAFVRTLLAEGLLEVDTFTDRLRETAMDDDTRSRLDTWVDVTAEDLG